MSTQLPTSMARHPDIMEMHDQYERASVTPRAQALEALAVISGLFLAVSPWIVGFTRFNHLTINDLILGLVFIGLLAGYGPVYERTHARAWAAMVIGVWTIIAPWAVTGAAHVQRTIVVNCATGGVMLLVSLAAIGMTVVMRSPHRGAGRSGSTTG